MKAPKRKSVLSVLFCALGFSLSAYGSATYDLSTLLNNNYSLVGSITLDVTSLASPPVLTVAEFNSLATYDIKVLLSGTEVAAFNDANSDFVDLSFAGTGEIRATSQELAFYLVSGSFVNFGISLATPQGEIDKILFLGLSSPSRGILRVGKVSGGAAGEAVFPVSGNPYLTFGGSSVPEPGTFGLLLCGLVATGFAARRRNRSREIPSQPGSTNDSHV